MIQNLTGKLQIGSANYSIFTGDGKSDSQGELMMIAESISGELILRGIIQHNTVTTDAPPSRLSSLAYLALSGSMTLTDATKSSEINVKLSQNATNTVENVPSTNTSVNSTSLTQSKSSTSSIANFTSQTEVSTESATLTASSIQSQDGTVAFHLTGQATSMNSTPVSLGPTTLDLSGGIHGDGVGGLVIENLTGSLQISSTNYSIFNGNGNSNRRGEFAIFGQSSSGELVLHGTIHNNSTVVTDAPPSRLSSLAYLALSGSIAMSAAIGSVSSVELSQSVTSMNPGVNSTSVTQQYVSSSSSAANFTSQTEVSTENATLSVSNVTSLSQTVAYALSGQNNTTVTSNQSNNQTITVYVSNSVAKSTITQTTTTTVAETTITQYSSVTISNSTVTVTNSTSSGP